jgi:hypothetical protein
VIERARARDNARRAQSILDLRSAVWADRDSLAEKIDALTDPGLAPRAPGDSPDGDDA